MAPGTRCGRTDRLSLQGSEMTRRAIADLDQEPGGACDVEAEHAVVVVASEPVRNGEARRPRPIERGTDVVTRRLLSTMR